MSDNGFSVSVDTIKKDHVAVAILLDIAYYTKREVSKIVKDLKLKQSERNILDVLADNGFLRPNPHKNVLDIKYVLTPKGYFLVNELKVENPELLKGIEPELVPF